MSVNPKQFEAARRAVSRIKDAKEDSGVLALELLTALGLTTELALPTDLVNTILSVATSPDDAVDQITLRPTGFEDPGAQWEVYIPPTAPWQFDGYDPEVWETWDEDARTEFMYQAPVLGPWGTTYWTTLEGAVLHLLIVVRQGNMRFNDGRVVK